MEKVDNDNEIWIGMLIFFRYVIIRMRKLRTLIVLDTFYGLLHFMEVLFYKLISEQKF